MKMINFVNCKNIFIDFDGVIVNSNEFKEKAIEESISKLFDKDLEGTTILTLKIKRK